jgi:hypothetical protein
MNDQVITDISRVQVNRAGCKNDYRGNPTTSARVVVTIRYPARSWQLVMNYIVPEDIVKFSGSAVQQVSVLLLNRSSNGLHGGCPP